MEGAPRQSTAALATPLALERNLALIKRVVREVCQRKGVLPKDEGELLGDVLLKLVNNDYAVLHAFRGDDLRVFLRTVVYRVLLDKRTAAWGKWRASRKAQNLGSAAVQLERLIARDRLTPREAVRVLAHDPRWKVTSDAARTMLAALPVKRRPLEVPLESDAFSASAVDFVREPREQRELELRAARISGALRTALRSMTIDERQLLSLRFRHGAAVADIARHTGVEQKALYRRYEQIFRRLRRALEQADVTIDEIRPLLGQGMVDNMLTSPSHHENSGRPEREVACSVDVRHIGTESNHGQPSFPVLNA